MIDDDSRVHFFYLTVTISANTIIIAQRNKRWRKDDLYV